MQGLHQHFPANTSGCDFVVGDLHGCWALLPEQLSQRLGELEAENAELKCMYADLALENSAIEDVLSRKP